MYCVLLLVVYIFRVYHSSRYCIFPRYTDRGVYCTVFLLCIYSVYTLAVGIFPRYTDRGVYCTVYLWCIYSVYTIAVGIFPRYTDRGGFIDTDRDLSNLISYKIIQRENVSAALSAPCYAHLPTHMYIHTVYAALSTPCYAHLPTHIYIYTVYIYIQYTVCSMLPCLRHAMRICPHILYIYTTIYLYNV